MSSSPLYDRDDDSPARTLRSILDSPGVHQGTDCFDALSAKLDEKAGLPFFFTSVLLQNISPAHLPDIVVYIDAITMVFNEASKGAVPLSLPIACIEVGDDHCLPNLALRRGEEHSFILKPASSMWKSPKISSERNFPSPLRYSQLVTETSSSNSNTDIYAIMVSCRCNYTESRLFFKQPTDWRPPISRDLLISVAPELSPQSSANDKASHLPVQILTLRASNLTSEDLTLTVLAPSSFSTPPSVGSLISAPSAPMDTGISVPGSARKRGDRAGSKMHSRMASVPDSQFGFAAGEVTSRYDFIILGNK